MQYYPGNWLNGQSRRRAGGLALLDGRNVEVNGDGLRDVLDTQVAGDLDGGLAGGGDVRGGEGDVWVLLLMRWVPTYVHLVDVSTILTDVRYWFT